MGGPRTLGGRAENFGYQGSTRDGRLEPQTVYSLGHCVFTSIEVYEGLGLRYVRRLKVLRGWNCRVRSMFHSQCCV